VDLPLCFGSAFPEGGAAPLQIHMLHRMVGVVAGLIAACAGLSAFGAVRGRPLLRVASVALPLLVVTQVTLGVLTIYTFRSTPIVVAHVGGAAALWAVCVGLWLGTRSTRTASAAAATFATEAAR
jgi:heme A synthase